ncbi:MAG: 16S rRNA (cytosine(1402)-N(4))-methyltransferase [Planctomycetota bacterium]
MREPGGAVNDAAPADGTAPDAPPPRRAATVHTPVLAAEALGLLALEPGMTVVDGTLGGGGHTRLLLDAVGPTGRVIACDLVVACGEGAAAGITVERGRRIVRSGGRQGALVGRVECRWLDDQLWLGDPRRRVDVGTGARRRARDEQLRAEDRHEAAAQQPEEAEEDLLLAVHGSRRQD